MLLVKHEAAVLQLRFAAARVEFAALAAQQHPGLTQLDVALKVPARDSRLMLASSLETPDCPG
jgi:hypothetical protein